MADPKKRLAWIDISRGIAILVIVAYHSNFFPFLPQLMPYFSSWMIVIFVLVGGVMFNGEQPWPVFFKKKLVGLIIPYIVYGGISFLLWLFFREMYAKPALWMRADDALQYFLAGHDLWFNATLWFLPCYFLSLLFARAIYPLWRDRKQSIQLLIIGILAIFSLLVMKRDERIFISVDIAFLFTSLLLVGKYIADRKIHFRVDNLALTVLLILFAVSAHFNGTIDLFFRKFDYPWLFFFHSILGSWIVANSAMRLESISHPLVQGLRRTGKYSLVILLTHWPLQQLLTFLLSLTGLFTLFPNTPTMTSFILREHSLVAENTFKVFWVVIYIGFCVVGAMLIDLMQKKCVEIFKKAE